MSFTFGSLFSGIGGIDLGLERAGMTCSWQVEIDEYAQKVLAKHWPNVARFRDVRTVGRDTLAGVDLVAGGFPCQPHSLAGERQASGDERDLWPEFYRIIRELKPRFVLGENVLGLLSSEDGSFFGTILRQLAEAGYDAEWFVLRASDMGAPHQRERVFIVAYTSGERQSSIRDRIPTRANDTTSASSDDVALPNGIGESGQESNFTRGQCGAPLSASIRGWEDRTQMAHTTECGLEEQQSTSRLHDQLNSSGIVAHASSQRCEEWHTSESFREAGLFAGRVETRPTSGQPQSRLGGMLDGLSDWLDRYQWPTGPGEAQHEWEPARVITERQPQRAARLKALGNAVVPQIAEMIGRCILESEAAS